MKRILVLVAILTVMTAHTAYAYEEFFHDDRISIDIPAGFTAAVEEYEYGDFVSAGYIISDDGKDYAQIVGMPYDGEFDYLFSEEDADDFYNAKGRHVLDRFFKDSLEDVYTEEPGFFRGDGSSFMFCTVRYNENDRIFGYVFMLPEDNSIQFIVFRGFGLKQAQDMASTYESYGFYDRKPALYEGSISTIVNSAVLAAAVAVCASFIAAVIRMRKKRLSGFSAASSVRRGHFGGKNRDAESSDDMTTYSTCTYEESLRTLYRSGLLTKDQLNEMIEKHRGE